MAAPLDRLMRVLARLPGIGSRSAERIAVKLAYGDDELRAELISALQEVSAKVRKCSRCGAVTTVEQDPCKLCTDVTRDGSVLCVVEEPSDVIAVERSGAIRGRYHVLMGKISPMNGKGPWDLRLKDLLERLEKEPIKEVILALSTDVESDATAGFIHELLKDRGVTVTRLAFGLPVGSGVAYSDPVTLQRAIRGRQGV